jgi:hypothetical protein
MTHSILCNEKKKGKKEGRRKRGQKTPCPLD